MSMTMISKSEEDEGDAENTTATDEKPKYGWRSRCPVWWIRAAAVGLGLLLLLVIFGLVAHHASSALSQQDSLLDHLMTRERLIHNITTDNKALRDELNQMKINSSTLTEDIEELQSLYNTVTARRDNLLQEHTTLKSSAACRVCPSGWIKFRNKCYYLSARGQTKNWEDSRKDCQQRGADLVKPTTKEEQDFVFTLNRVTWIGLSDRKQEGKWLWVDGTALQTGIWNIGEPNSTGDEDCAMVVENGKWNDLACSSALSWMCED